MGHREREFTRSTKNEIWRRQKNRCDLCGEICHGHNARRIGHIHHINPHSWGGSRNIENGVGLCPSCHSMIDNYIFKEGIFYDEIKKSRRSTLP